MKTLSDTTEILIERWEDPGDYPNAVANGPLPSYDYVAGIEGDVVVELRPDEFDDFLDVVKDESPEFWMVEVFDYDCPDGLLSVTWDWEFFGGKRCGFLWLKRKKIVRLWATEVEPDPNYRGPEPDEDYLIELQREREEEGWL